MSRACGWCGSIDRVELERRVLSGEPIRLVSLDTPYSASAGHRHFRNHVDGAALRDVRGGIASRMQLIGFADRLVNLANAAAAAREFAAQRGDARLMLLAVHEESQVLGTLMGKLGIDDTELVDLLREAKALAVAVSDAVKDQPVVARSIARTLADANQVQLADAFTRMADRAMQPSQRNLEVA